VRIGIDIDDVLFPWSQHAHEACERAGITNGKQVTQWGMHIDYGCTSDQVWDVINAAYVAGMLVAHQPYDGVVEILDDLRAAGHTVHLATARGFEGPLANMVREHTVAWLTSHEIPHDSLTFTADKSVLNVDVFLDDGVHNVIALQKAGIRAFLRDQPHNHASDLPRVDDLAAFARLIHEELAC
jgi:FMN phosphatase YigB (HAD superfamily)